MKVILYCIADTRLYGKFGAENPVTLDKFEFDSEDQEIRETLEEYAPDEELTDENMESVCREYLVESELSWDQRGISYVILNQGQLNLLKQLIKTSK